MAAREARERRRIGPEAEDSNHGWGGWGDAFATLVCPRFALAVGNVADCHTAEIGLESLQTNGEAAGGRFLQADAGVGEPAVGQFSESDAARRLGLIEAGDFLADRGQASPRECGIGGFEGSADLLAAAFEQAIISAR